MTAMKIHPQKSGPLHCSQCGAELNVEEGKVFLKCSYCDSTVYLDRSRVVLHWYLVDTLDSEKAMSTLLRWMAGNKTPKGLDRKAQIKPVEFAYFPIWVIHIESDGKKNFLIERAAASSITDLKKLHLPAGDLRAFNSEIGLSSILPTIPLETVMSRHTEIYVDAQKILSVSLVHLPLYTFHYTYDGKAYAVAVEGATGSVFALDYPKKAAKAYIFITIIIGLVYFFLASLPFITKSIVESAFTRYVISIVLIWIASPFLYAGAVWVAENR